MKFKYSRRDFIKNISIGAVSAAPAVSAMAACAGNSKKDKLGIALAGLGSYSTYQLGPALLETKHCYLSGIVTGTPAKDFFNRHAFGSPPYLKPLAQSISNNFP